MPQNMARAHPVRSPRVAETIAKRIDNVVAQIGYGTFNQVTELMLTQMLDLIEQPPGERKVPPLALLLDGLQKPAQFSDNKPDALAAQAAHHALASAKVGEKKR